MISDSFTVTALLFDLDNTLFDRDQAVRRWVEDFARSRLALVNGDAHLEAVAFALALDAHGYGAKPPMFAALKERYPVLTESIENMVDAFYTQVSGYASLEKSALRLLDTLDRAHLPFGIVTNGSRYQMRTIKALGLDRRTSCLLVSELAGCRKPDAAIFLTAAAHLGAQPNDVLFVGDNPEVDIWGAHRAGMRTAWLHRDQPWPTSLARECVDLTIDSLDDLAHIIA